MNRLKEFAKAIEEVEHYAPGTRAWRNNSPGNLRWSIFQAGQRDGFAFFLSYNDGFKALMYDIEQKCKGNTRTNLGPEKTVEDFFKVWAPTYDHNNPTAYASRVAGKLNLSVTTKLKEIIAESEPIQRILVVLNGFPEDRKLLVKDAFENLKEWFKNQEIDTSIHFAETEVSPPVIRIKGLAGTEYEIQEVSVLDPNEVNKVLSPFIADHHFTVFAYHQINAGLTPTEFHNLHLGTLVTQLPVLVVSNQDWIKLFAIHEILHGWYIRAVNAKIGIKDNVHIEIYEKIVEKLTPYLSLIFSRDLVPHIYQDVEIIQGYQISWSQKLINLMKDLIGLLTK